MTDRVTRLNRQALRSYGARRRREERREAAHRCRVSESKMQAGLKVAVDVTVAFYHDLHRVLREPYCPQCPRCCLLKRVGRIDRKPADPEGIRQKWERLLEDAAEPCITP